MYRSMYIDSCQCKSLKYAAEVTSLQSCFLPMLHSIADADGVVPQVDIAPEILAELEQKEDHANALALSLMAKENELEHLQVDLKVSSSTFYPTVVTDEQPHIKTTSILL